MPARVPKPQIVLRTPHDYREAVFRLAAIAGDADVSAMLERLIAREARRHNVAMPVRANPAGVYSRPPRE